VSAHPQNGEVAGGVSLDALFRANAVGRPELTALVDPPNKQQFTDLPVRRLSFDETDLAVEHLARRLRELGLPNGSVVAVQLPNTVEAIVSLLAIARAGLIAAPVPMAWRRSDLVAALRRVEPKAIITLSQLDGERPAETACEVAAELFNLSFPCAFGTDLPDGVIALELDCSVPDPSERVANGHGTRGASILTFDAAADGFFPVARNDAQWLAAGLAVLLEARVESGDTIVSTLPPNSLAGIGGAILPWLLSGGVLELLHGADLPAIDGAGAGKSGRKHLLAPATAMPDLAAGRSVPLASCIAVHRRPQSLGLDFSPLRSERVVDLMSVGEIGMIALRRLETSHAGGIPLGPITAPSATRGGPVVIETRIAGGELLLRGPQVPRATSPEGHQTPRLEFDPDGFVRTGYRCLDAEEQRLILTAGPEGVVSVGGLRFGLDDLRSRFAQSSAGIKIAFTEDPLLGERFRIEAENPSVAAAALKAGGHSPLLVQAAAFGSALQRAAE